MSNANKVIFFIVYTKLKHFRLFINSLFLISFTNKKEKKLLGILYTNPVNYLLLQQNPDTWQCHAQLLLTRQKTPTHFFFAHQNIETDIRMRSNLRERAATDVHTSRQFIFPNRTGFISSCLSRDCLRDLSHYTKQMGPPGNPVWELVRQMGFGNSHFRSRFHPGSGLWTVRASFWFICTEPDGNSEHDSVDLENYINRLWKSCNYY